MDLFRKWERAQVSRHIKTIDSKALEDQKSMVNREILKLQQRMKQIVASPDDKYTDLQFDKNHQMHLSSETPVMC